jgi:hypothetical protein
VYTETRARFALGIAMVLFALLVQAAEQYPLLLGLAGQYSGGEPECLSVAGLFTIAAYTIFLYLGQ